MKRQRSEKSKYKHVTTGDYCTCAAFVAEKMIMNLAAFENVAVLPHKFWNHKKWSWKFKKQVMLAIGLINKYGEKPLVQAVQSPELRGVFSLKNQRVERTVKKYKKILDAAPTTTQQLDVKENPVQRKTTFGKKGGINKLRGLDGRSEAKDQQSQDEV